MVSIWERDCAWAGIEVGGCRSQAIRDLDSRKGRGIGNQVEKERKKDKLEEMFSKGQG